MTLSIKREKVCTVCTYLLFTFERRDVRSEGSTGIKIVKKFDFNFLVNFDSVSLPHSKNGVLAKMSMCVCVCVCLSVHPLPNVVPKPTERSSSHSISRILLQISQTVFLVFDLPLKLRVLHIRNNKKF